MAQDRFIVSIGVRIYGMVETDLDVLVSGRIDGTLACSRVKIKAGGSVIGDIIAEHAIIDGLVEGNIYAQRLTLASNCKVYGDIHHGKLELREGCYFEGKSRQSKQPRRLAPAPSFARTTDRVD
ncbi:MAG: bactofilin family protein [Hyphomicrobiaceae bacterium]